MTWNYWCWCNSFFFCRAVFQLVQLLLFQCFAPKVLLCCVSFSSFWVLSFLDHLYCFVIFCLTKLLCCPFSHLFSGCMFAFLLLLLPFLPIHNLVLISVKARYTSSYSTSTPQALLSSLSLFLKSWYHLSNFPLTDLSFHFLFKCSAIVARPLSFEPGRHLCSSSTRTSLHSSALCFFSQIKSSRFAMAAKKSAKCQPNYNTSQISRTFGVL